MIGGSPDYNTGKFTTLYGFNNNPTFLYGNIAWSTTATHYALQFTEDGNDYARFSLALVHMQAANEK